MNSSARQRRSSMPLHDTHCHVDLMSSPGEAVRRRDLAGIHTIAVTTLPSFFQPLLLFLRESQFVRAGLGFHPELVGRAGKEEASLFVELLHLTRYVGEVGLDYQSSDEQVRREQRKVFHGIVAACDKVGGKILTVHSRRAAKDVVDAFGASFRGKYILHWFSGSRRVLEGALANGAYISVNAAMLRSEQGRKICLETPIDRVLLETDAPFVRRKAPEADESGESYDVGAIGETASGLAALYQIAPEELAQQLRSNLQALLR